MAPRKKEGLIVHTTRSQSQFKSKSERNRFENELLKAVGKASAQLKKSSYSTRKSESFLDSNSSSPVKLSSQVESRQRNSKISNDEKSLSKEKGPKKRARAKSTLISPIPNSIPMIKNRSSRKEEDLISKGSVQSTRGIRNNSQSIDNSNKSQFGSPKKQNMRQRSRKFKKKELERSLSTSRSSSPPVEKRVRNGNIIQQNQVNEIHSDPKSARASSSRKRYPQEVDNCDSENIYARPKYNWSSNSDSVNKSKRATLLKDLQANKNKSQYTEVFMLQEEHLEKQAKEYELMMIKRKSELLEKIKGENTKHQAQLNEFQVKQGKLKKEYEKNKKADVINVDPIIKKVEEELLINNPPVLKEDDQNSTVKGKKKKESNIKSRRNASEIQQQERYEAITEFSEDQKESSNQTQTQKVIQSQNAVLPSQSISIIANQQTEKYEIKNLKIEKKQRKQSQKQSKQAEKIDSEYNMGNLEDKNDAQNNVLPSQKIFETSQIKDSPIYRIEAEIITPIEKRYAELTVKPIRNVYDDAIEMLQEYSLPEEIPCRDIEKAEIAEFLKHGIDNNGSSSCLYISGVPGIGKTASFLEVIKKMKQERDDFTFIHINAMNLSNPENLYIILVKEITGMTSCSKSQACPILNELFTKGKLPKKYEKLNTSIDNKNRVILLDELDYLVTKDQEVLYNLMEWPQHKDSRLTLVGIANTMNLPEQLMQKIRSRMGSRRLVFNQYTNVQIQKIIGQRLSDLKDIFEPTAIEFACRKIAVSSSDIRRTLKVLRKAVELASASTPTQMHIKVAIQHIQQAHTALYSSPNIQAIKRLAFHHKLLILSISLENKHRNLPLAYFTDCYDRYRIMASSFGGHPALEQKELRNVIKQLGNYGIISSKEKAISNAKEANILSIDPNKKQISNVVEILITSNFVVDDVTNALREDDLYIKFQFQF